MKIVWEVNDRACLLSLGRNDDCPCGSHLKFKYCCIDKTDRPKLMGHPKGPKKERTLWEKIQIAYMNRPKKKVSSTSDVIKNKFELDKIPENAKLDRAIAQERKEL